MIIGTRGSRLAVSQTEIVTSKLGKKFPDLQIEVRLISTTGDRVRDRPLRSLGGFGAFVKELDDRILSGEIDASVNSLKDMPVVCTEGTRIAAVLPRGPVEDVIISKRPLEELPRGAVVGTSSVRRRAMLLNVRPDLVIKDLRGNVTTRLSRLREGKFDAIVLAKAGLERLEVDCEAFVLDPTIFIPAVGQGAIAISCANGSKHFETLSALNDTETRLCVEAERYVLSGMGGGCSVPIGIWAVKELDALRMRGIVLAEDGSRAFRLDRHLDVENLKVGLDRFVKEMMMGWEDIR
ncbi:MAG: hydroxymethylbilane synthase [Methanomassiliicoccales archaeon]|nr:MAG: hydroxymethylbilane synthase [Methanomassiliicoccales archaeon]